MRKLILALLALPLSALACALHEVHVHDAYVRATPPGQMNSAAYMTIHNTDKNDYRLVAVVSKAARLVQLHNVEEVDGVARMQQVDFIDIAANDKTALQPGGYHIMLIDLTQSLEPGDELDFTLVYNDGSRTELVVPVVDIRNMGEVAAVDDHHHH
jgi:hypothetical protein